MRSPELGPRHRVAGRHRGASARVARRLGAKRTRRAICRPARRAKRKKPVAAGRCPRFKAEFKADLNGAVATSGNSKGVRRERRGLFRHDRPAGRSGAAFTSTRSCTAPSSKSQRKAPRQQLQPRAGVRSAAIAAPAPVSFRVDRAVSCSIWSTIRLAQSCSRGRVADPAIGYATWCCGGAAPSPRLRGEGRGEGGVSTNSDPNAQTRGEAPSPRNLREERANSDLSPARRGGGEGRGRRTPALLLIEMGANPAAAVPP